jgi:fatty acyl-CoA reductase
LVGKFKNTYIFSKALSEEVVRLYSNGLPVCIVRPSIIVSTMYEPIRGWADNINGANGAAAFILHLALLRTVRGDVSKTADLIPADYVVNNIIVAAWGVNKQSREVTYNTKESRSSASAVEPPIYNCVSSCQNPLSWKEFVELVKKHGTEVISSKAMWYCVFYPTKYEWIYRIYTIFLHYVPAVIIDMLAILSGRKAKLYKTTKKVQKFSESVEFTTLQSSKYNNKNVMKLWDRINSTDKKLFDFNVKNFDWKEFFIPYTRGLRVYVLKEPMSNLGESITRYKRLKLAHFTMVGVVVLFLLQILYLFPYLLSSICAQFKSCV